MVYFDNAATTPVPKAVADAMYEVLTAHFGNPSSQYPMGVEMKKAVEVYDEHTIDYYKTFSEIIVVLADDGEITATWVRKD